jgi:hypothetical protein
MMICVICSLVALYAPMTLVAVLTTEKMISDHDDSFSFCRLCGRASFRIFFFVLIVHVQMGFAFSSNTVTEIGSGERTKIDR